MESYEDIQIVISSSWRTYCTENGLALYTVDYLRHLFQEYEFSKHILGVTPIHKRKRHLEIEQWLSDHECENYIVIDDLKELSCFGNRFIYCTKDLFGEKERMQAINSLN